MADEEEPEQEDNRPRGKVNDPDEAGQQARIRAIQQALQEAVARRTASEDSVLSGGSTHQERLRYYRTGVEEFLLQLVSLAERTQANQYWEHAEIGKVVVPLPEEIQEAMRNSSTRIPWGADKPEPKVLTITGLSGFLTHTWPHTESFSVPLGRADELEAETTVEPPMNVIDNALITALRFLGETGLDIELDMSKPTMRDFDASRPSEQIDYEEVRGSPDL